MDIGENDFKKQTYDLESQILTSEEALQCLTNEEGIVMLPMPSARACNNLDEYFSRSTAKKHKTIHKDHDTRNGASSSKHEKPFSVPLIRNFDHILKKPHQAQHESSALLQLLAPPKKQKQDLFSRLEQVESTKGPLMHLKKNLNKPVRVLIRRRRKVAYVSRVIEYKGTLVLFDKHMNMYLDNVTESFNYHLDGNLMKRTRFRKKVFIRGDNIILVS